MTKFKKYLAIFLCLWPLLQLLISPCSGAWVKTANCCQKAQSHCHGSAGPASAENSSLPCPLENSCPCHSPSIALHRQQHLHLTFRLFCKTLPMPHWKSGVPSTFVSRLFRPPIAVHS